MDLYQHSKEAYAAELERRNELRHALNMPVSLSVVFAGAIFSLFRVFPWESVSLGLVVCIFTVAWALSLICLAVTICFLIRCHVGHEYAYVATPQEILEYRKQLVEHYADSSCDESTIDTEVQDFLEQEYANNAHHNALKNNTRSGHLHAANQFLVATLAFTAFAGVMLLFVGLMG